MPTKSNNPFYFQWYKVRAQVAVGWGRTVSEWERPPWQPPGEGAPRATSTLIKQYKTQSSGLRCTCVVSVRFSPAHTTLPPEWTFDTHPIKRKREISAISWSRRFVSNQLFDDMCKRSAGQEKRIFLNIPKSSKIGFTASYMVIT